MNRLVAGGRIGEPLMLRPRILPKVWGGTRVGEMFGAALAAGSANGGAVDPAAAGAPIGEAWLAWEGSIVADGPHAGRSVGELVQAAPQAVLGRGAAAGAPRFPSLVKLLDTSAWLSVQVHPDDDYARRVEGEPFGKAEVWLVLAAEPGAQIIHGLRHAMTSDDLRAAVESGRVLDHVRYRPVAPGDVIFNPPGTIHALGQGILLYELQQASDLTYRLYDWDRSGSEMNRPLHVDKALDVARCLPEAVFAAALPPAPPELAHNAVPPLAAGERVARPPAVPGAAGRRTLCTCAHFCLEEIRGADKTAHDTGGRSFDLLTVLAGDVDLTWQGGRLALAAPSTVLIPAVLGAYQLGPAARDTGAGARPEARAAGFRVLRAYVPDLA